MAASRDCIRDRSDLTVNQALDLLNWINFEGRRQGHVFPERSSVSGALCMASLGLLSRGAWAVLTIPVLLLCVRVRPYDMSVDRDDTMAHSYWLEGPGVGCV
jgi:hypothetical protein